MKTALHRMLVPLRDFLRGFLGLAGAAHSGRHRAPSSQEARAALQERAAHRRNCC